MRLASELVQSWGNRIVRIAVLLVVSTLLAPFFASAAEPAATPPPQSTAQAADSAAQMQQKIKVMAEEMAKIQATTDPAERQRLMQQHMQSMAGFMQAMHAGGAMGPGMMAGGSSMMNAQAMGGMHGGPGNADVNARLDRIDQRLDLLTQMVDQLVQHEQAAQKDK
jgi:hypothetical protein